MTANNKDKRKRTKKSGVFKRLEEKESARLHQELLYQISEFNRLWN